MSRGCASQIRQGRRERQPEEPFSLPTDEEIEQWSGEYEQLRRKLKKKRPRGARARRAIIKKFVIQRDHHKCTRCGARQNLQCHHVVPKAENGKFRPENLVTLCESCHVAHHRKLGRKNHREESSVRVV